MAIRRSIDCLFVGQDGRLEVESTLADVDSLLGDDPKLEVPREEYEDRVELLAGVDSLLVDGDSLLDEAVLAGVDSLLADF